MEITAKIKVKVRRNKVDLAKVKANRVITVPMCLQVISMSINTPKSQSNSFQKAPTGLNLPKKNKNRIQIQDKLNKSQISSKPLAKTLLKIFRMSLIKPQNLVRSFPTAHSHIMTKKTNRSGRL